jgi:transcription elongation GreA/GreB family factor
MSRAFVKEDGPDNAALPDLPISPHPNYVTPRGYAALQRRLTETLAMLAQLKLRAERLDLMPERSAERDIRYLDARLRSAILIDLNMQPKDRVAFGARVTVIDDQGNTQNFEITGEDEADAAQGRIAPHSPIARALLHGQVGDVVEWVRPIGRTHVEIAAISYG